MIAHKNKNVTDLLQEKLNLKRQSARAYASQIRKLYTEMKRTGDIDLKFLDADTVVKRVRDISNVGQRKNMSSAALAGARATNLSQKRQNQYREVMMTADLHYKQWAGSGKRTKNFTGDATVLWKAIRTLHKKAGRVLTAKGIFRRDTHTYGDMVSIQQFIYCKLLSHFEPRRLEYASLRFITPAKLELFSKTEKAGFNYILMAPKTWRLVWNSYKTSRTYGEQSFDIPTGLKTTLRKLHAILEKRVPAGWVFFTRNNHHMSRSTFSKFVKELFRMFMGKPYTQNTVRSIRVSSMFAKAPATKKLLELQQGMGSTLETLALNYRVPQNQS
jgi:hypothetical protein